MPRSETTVGLPQARATAIRWKRVIFAAFLSELAVIAVLSAVLATYAFVIAPGRSSAEYNEFGQNAGYYLAAPAAALATFLMAFWAVRTLDSAFVVNGALVG